MDQGKYSVYLKTVQSGAVRTLFEALKEVLNDVNVTFTAEGIRIMAMDGTKVALIHLKLVATSFEIYHCDHLQKAGVNMNSLFKLLKTIGTNDTLSMYISKNDSTRLGIKIENKDKNMQTESTLKLLDIDEDILRIPDYRRVDIGFSAVLKAADTKNKLKWLNPFSSIWLSAEVFNLLAIDNTISYLWVADVNGREYAVPNYLTTRQLNAKLILTF